MNKLKMLALTGGLLVLSHPVSAQVLLSDNFNSENGGVGQLNYNSFANWTVANSVSQGGTVDLIGNGFYDFFPGNGLYIDLDGSGNGVPGLLQSKTDFNFVPGVDYSLSFDLAGSARGLDENVLINLGSFLSANVFLPSATPYTLIDLNFTVSTDTSGYLSFQNVQPGDVGAILDNVNLVGTPASSVPDGGSTALLAGGVMCALTTIGRIRKGVALK